MSFSLAVKHNIEVAHRLSLLPGKCEAIHGHSMWVTLEMHSAEPLDERYLVEGMDFGAIKKEFRGYLDTEFDHRLLLNADDIWAQPIYRVDTLNETGELIGPNGNPTSIKALIPTGGQEWLPGLRLMDGDPSTENIAREIGKWAQQMFGLHLMYDVTVWETAVNMARYRG